MNIEEGAIVQKQDDPAMWGTITEIDLASGMLKVESSAESVAATGVKEFQVHVSLASEHKSS